LGIREGCIRELGVIVDAAIGDLRDGALDVNSATARNHVVRQNRTGSPMGA